jgi:hypothetical protein
MSIFKRSSSDAQKSNAATATAPGPDAKPAAPSFAPASNAPGVVPPLAAPMYAMRQPEAPAVPASESIVAAKVRTAREAQDTARERVRVAVQHERSHSPAPGIRRGAVQQAAPPCTSRREIHYPSDPDSCAQHGLLTLAWAWQEAGSPIRAINTYVELLRRYPGTPAAAAAVSDLVTLSEKLTAQGNFHTALVIYDHLECLV